MRKNVQISIIIPNYKGEKLLKKNIPHVIKAYKNPKNSILEIIVVDDCSEDKSVEYLKKHYPEIRIIQHKINRGFASSVNTGARTSRGKYLALLNSDVAPREDFLEHISKHFRKKNVFAVSLHEKNYGYAKGKFENGFIIHQPGKESGRSQDTFWVSGGSGVFRRDIWMKLGGFDEELFKFYWEDVDLSYRAAKRGYRLLWEPSAKVVHKHESTTKRIFSLKNLRRMQETNQLIFIWKNLTSKVLFRRHSSGLVKKLLRRPGYFLIVIKTLLKIKKIYKARKKEKENAKCQTKRFLQGLIK